MLEELVKLFQEAGLDEAKSTGERIAAMGRFGAAPTGEPVKTPPPSFSQPDTWINIPYYHEAALLLAQRAARIESRFGISALQAYFS
ncbi:MAG: hypothetical protein FJZ00_12610, partial [Candidatus Sericytochromatia bacterium]|nr:hypothetical protein [Candidatus Tanganyikabacteria bacterium]